LSPALFVPLKSINAFSSQFAVNVTVPLVVLKFLKYVDFIFVVVLAIVLVIALVLVPCLAVSSYPVIVHPANV